MNNTFIAIRDLVINYYTFGAVIKALRGVDLYVDRGEATCIVGESGSGKSTLVQALALILPKNAVVEQGSIIYEGIDILRNNNPSILSKIRREIGIVFQDPATTFNPLFTIKQQFVDVLIDVLRVTPKEAIEISKEALKSARLIEVDRILNSYPHELSGGMLQRASIALALAKKPKVLIADEPTTNLDVTTQAEILNLIKMLKKEYNLTLIMVTHNLGIAKHMCDKVAVMYAGSIVEEGPIEEVLKNPLHPYTRGLLRAIPKLSVAGDSLTPVQGSSPDPREDFKGCSYHSRCDSSKPVCTIQKPPRIAFNKRIVLCHLYRGS
ncbi:MAG: ABC transporter ATP-binding protein [Desulfurococcus sp.]|uniref:ABC transporter ATP-binding protein n=1 Tax=Desulfurococcus sp. TaxID=51678 RepID=UPI00317B279B